MQVLIGLTAIGAFCLVAAIIETLSDHQPSPKLKRKKQPSRNRKYS